MKSLILSLFLISCVPNQKLPHPPQPVPKPIENKSIAHIPYTKFTTKNGLTVIVHEDRKAPIVAVSVWYKVGSKEEPKGRSGFAHLFEHLMFNGSENYNDEYFGPFHKVGATNMNGTTWFDRTNYFQNVPTPALPMALWMESDRMGHLLGAINQAKLDEQRGVVQNEKRMRDNRPYAKSYYHILEGLFPPGHPYRHSTIGSMKDLNAASLKDVKEWFKKYYGAANAVLILAGDINVKKAKAIAKKYFGHIPSGPELTKIQSMIPTRNHDSHEIMYDNVPEVRIYKVWAVPGRTEKDTALLKLAARILGQGKNSRLYQALVHQNQLASKVEAYVEEHQLTSQFAIEVTIKKDISRLKVDKIINKILAEFFNHPVSADELQRAQTGIESNFIRSIEEIGGMRGKAAILAQGELYANDPGFYKTHMNWIKKTTPSELQKTAKKWISTGLYQLMVLPFPKFKIAHGHVERKKGPPIVKEMPRLTLPKIGRGKLKNNIKVVLMENHATPIVHISMQFDAGFAADSTGIKLGTSQLTLSMLDEGTKSHNALDIGLQKERLGARIWTDSNLDMSSVNLSALQKNLKKSLALFADIIQNPVFDEKEFKRLRSKWLSKIKQEKAKPFAIAFRNLPPLLYGKGHAYAIPFTGSGTEKSINSIKQADLIKFYKAWIRPDNATLFVVGDTNLKEILPLLNTFFAHWPIPKISKPLKNIPHINSTEQKIVIIDKPNAPQSLIFAGKLAPSSGTPNNIEIKAMNDILGGTFLSRINMNLREDKHWAYFSRTHILDAKGQRPFFIHAPVQTDKTGAAIKELLKELAHYTTKRPATKKELAQTISNNINKLPGAFETNTAMLEGLLNNHRFNRKDNYLNQLSIKYQNLKLAGVRNAARKIVKPNQFIWMIVGDRKEILKQIKGIDLGEIIFMNNNGEIIP